MRFLYLPFIIIIYPFICGFTFEEDVLAKCGAKHPNDFIGRFVCNRNIVKQNKLDLCLEKNIKYHQKESKLLYSMLDSSFPSKIEDVAALINDKYKIKSTLQPSSGDPSRRVIIFPLNLKCESGNNFYINIHEDSNGFANVMRGWRSDLKNPEEKSRREFDFDWDSKSTKRKISICQKNGGYIFEGESCTEANQMEINNMHYIISKFIDNTKDQFTYKGALTEKYNADFIKLQADLLTILKSKMDSFSFEIDSKSNPIRINFISNFEKGEFSDVSFHLKLIKNDDKITISTNAPFESDLPRTFNIPITVTPLIIDNPSLNNKISENDKVDIKNDIFYILFPIICILLFLSIYFFNSKRLKNNSLLKEANRFHSGENHNSTRLKESYIFQATKDYEGSTTESPLIKYKVTKFEADEYREKFQAKFPFVTIYVPPNKRSQFIKECEWLEKKLGHFPSELEQKEILNSIDG